MRFIELNLHIPEHKAKNLREWCEGWSRISIAPTHVVAVQPGPVPRAPTLVLLATGAQLEVVESYERVLELLRGADECSELRIAG